MESIKPAYVNWSVRCGQRERASNQPDHCRCSAVDAQSEEAGASELTDVVLCSQNCLSTEWYQAMNRIQHCTRQTANSSFNSTSAALRRRAPGTSFTDARLAEKVHTTQRHAVKLKQAPHNDCQAQPLKSRQQVIASRLNPIANPFFTEQKSSQSQHNEPEPRHALCRLELRTSDQ